FIPALDLDLSFAPGERIHTENSYKYTDAMIASILRESGFTLENTWCDRKKWFGVHLARVVKLETLRFAGWSTPFEAGQRTAGGNASPAPAHRPRRSDREGILKVVQGNR